MSIPGHIQRLIEAHRMEQVEPEPEKVLVLWEKAVASSRDSRKGLSPDNAVTLGYQAAMQAASAALEAAGYRTKGSGPGHHYNTFYALAALGYAGLEEVDVESERIRSRRVIAFYDPEEASEEDTQAVHHWLDRMLPSLRRALVAMLPELEARLSEA